MESYEDLINRINELEKTIKNQSEELELLEAAFNLSEVGFTLSNSEGIVIKINPSQVRITGHDPGKTLGRSMVDIELENFNQSATMKVVKTQKPVTIEQLLPTGKSYLVYGQPYFDKEGRFKYVICNLVDNTQHNLVRQELEAAKSDNLELERTVHHLQEIMEMQKNLVYTSEKMQRLINICDKVAPFDSTILIQGESGVGKEVIADYIYQKSSRSDKDFIKINCAAIPEALLESELFGYESGAFTHAKAGGKKGILEMAMGGTVLLDEIGELPLHLQSKLLRFLQEGEFYRVGGTKPITADIRIIASTNRNLEKMTGEGTFRKDLYYRLSVINITVPSLKERKEDTPLLIRYFLARFNERYNLNKELTFGAMVHLIELPYEGNIRDLQNVIERVVLLSQNNTISVQDVIMALSQDYSSHIDSDNDEDNNTNLSLKDMVSLYEKELLIKYWHEYKSASRIAEILHTSQPTVSRKLASYGII